MKKRKYGLSTKTGKTNLKKTIQKVMSDYESAIAVSIKLRLLECTPEEWTMLNIFKGNDARKFLIAAGHTKKRMINAGALFSERCYDVHHHLAVQFRSLGMDCEVAYGDVFYRGKSLFNVRPEEMLAELKGGEGVLRGHSWLVFGGCDSVDCSLADWLAANTSYKAFKGMEENFASVIHTELSEVSFTNIVDSATSSEAGFSRKELTMGELVYKPVVIGSRAFRLFSGGNVGQLVQSS